MEKDDELKAGHCVEPSRGMQLCAAAGRTKDIKAVRRAVEANGAISSALTVSPRNLKSKEGCQSARWCSE